MATAINCTSTTVMATWGTEWFGVSRIQYILSFSIMMWSVSFTPMILAPISEVVSCVMHRYYSKAKLTSL
jgi:hypothetical protein